MDSSSWMSAAPQSPDALGLLEPLLGMPRDPKDGFHVGTK